MALTDIKNLALCIINCFVNIVWLVESNLGNIGCCTNQATKACGITNNLCVAIGASDRWCCVLQRK